jgi:general L-amino acid transport system substrate-binding protein
MIAALLALAAVPTTPAPVRCGAVERPGIAERGGDGVWRGVAVDLCRQAAQAEQGPHAEIAFRPYRRIEDLRDARHDALVVLSRAELAIAWPGAPSRPPVVISRQVLLVAPTAPLRSRNDLAGHRVCFIVASEAEAALNAWARPARVAIQRVGFQEPVELRDAFDAGYCAAMAVDAQDIPGGAEHTRELGPALAELPLFVVTAGTR